jgi:hypothetical protein
MDPLKDIKMKHPILSILTISAAALFGAAQVQAASHTAHVKDGQQSVKGQAKGMAQDRAIAGDSKTRAEVKADAASAVKDGQQSVEGQAKGMAQDKAIAGDAKTRAEVKAKAVAANPVDGQQSVKGQAKGMAQDKKQ